jgi:hypothetical protein
MKSIEHIQMILITNSRQVLTYDTPCYYVHVLLLSIICWT